MVNKLEGEHPMDFEVKEGGKIVRVDFEEIRIIFCRNGTWGVESKADEKHEK